jgi:hypothetical protein
MTSAVVLVACVVIETVAQVAGTFDLVRLKSVVRLDQHHELACDDQSRCLSDFQRAGLGLKTMPVGHSRVSGFDYRDKGERCQVHPERRPFRHSTCLFQVATDPSDTNQAHFCRFAQYPVEEVQG